MISCLDMVIAQNVELEHEMCTTKLKKEYEICTTKLKAMQNSVDDQTKHGRNNFKRINRQVYHPTGFRKEKGCCSFEKKV